MLLLSRHPPALPRSGARGFTLIELIVVIVILGVLAAVALPKFMDMRTDARIAAVRGMEAAVRDALRLIHAKCVVSITTCNINAGYYSAVPPTVIVNGVTHRLQFGYPWDDYTGQGGGLPALINNAGFVDLHHWSTNRGTHMSLVGANDPNNCSVSYRMPTVAGEAPSITVKTSGC